MKLEKVLFECYCKKQKKFRMIFDGGSTGNYVVELCSKCRKNEDHEFLLKEETL